MSAFIKQLGFGKKQASMIDAQTVSPESGSSSDIQASSDVKDEKGLDIGVDQSTVVRASGTDHRISELEAHTTLKQIKQKHQWDPNLPDELEEEIEGETDNHNLVGELRLVDELVENSPYPEVRAAVRNVSRSIPLSGRLLRISLSMTRTYPSIRFVPGYLACSSPPLRLVSMLCSLCGSQLSPSLPSPCSLWLTLWEWDGTTQCRSGAFDSSENRSV